MSETPKEKIANALYVNTMAQLSYADSVMIVQNFVASRVKEQMEEMSPEDLKQIEEELIAQESSIISPDNKIIT